MSATFVGNEQAVQKLCAEYSNTSIRRPFDS